MMINKDMPIIVKGNGLACYRHEQSAHVISYKIAENAIVSAIYDQINNLKHEKPFCVATRRSSFVNFTFEGKKSLSDICDFLHSISEDIVYSEFAFVFPDNTVMRFTVSFGKSKVEIFE